MSICITLTSRMSAGLLACLKEALRTRGIECTQQRPSKSKLSFLLIKLHRPIQGDAYGTLGIQATTAYLYSVTADERPELQEAVKAAVGKYSRVPQGTKFGRDRTESMLHKVSVVRVLQRFRIIGDIFPLHTEARSAGLFEDYRNLNMYYGDSVGYYFGFLSVYTKWLSVPALLGILLSFPNALESDTRWIIMSVATTLWGLLLMDVGWVTKKASLKRQWDNPRSSLKHIRSHAIDEILEDIPTQSLYVDASVSSTHFGLVLRRLLSAVLLAFSLLGSCGSLMWTLHIERTYQVNPMIVSVIFSIVRIFLSWAFMKLGNWLTRIERHVDDSNFMVSEVSKVIMFEVFNVFVPPIWMAFVISDFDRLSREVTVMFTTRQVVSALTEAVPTLLARLMTKRKHLAPLTAAAQHSLPEWGLWREYLEMAVQLAQLVAFGPLFPVAFVLAYVNDLVEFRLDAIKLNSSRRPYPRKEAMGSFWTNVFNGMVLFGASINVFTLIVHSETLAELDASMVHRLGVGIILEKFFVVVRVFVAIAIPKPNEWSENEIGPLAESTELAEIVARASAHLELPFPDVDQKDATLINTIDSDIETLISRMAVLRNRKSSRPVRVDSSD
ncbi:hypothetical protein FOZ61_001579 [Perkinsus olseni]|uniref:Anoctamin transmembrane domain-containing protein n=1 Tax=Perkinsus olseni TaxID=32597 RepID=A0A7J6MGQ5_PEROL|nr:hypothetical protein FOZ61_001579 [Perkinsus olseni]